MSVEEGSMPASTDPSDSDGSPPFARSGAENSSNEDDTTEAASGSGSDSDEAEVGSDKVGRDEIGELGGGSSGGSGSPESPSESEENSSGADGDSFESWSGVETDDEGRCSDGNGSVCSDSEGSEAGVFEPVGLAATAGELLNEEAVSKRIEEATACADVETLLKLACSIIRSVFKLVATSGSAEDAGSGRKRAASSSVQKRQAAARLQEMAPFKFDKDVIDHKQHVYGVCEGLGALHGTRGFLGAEGEWYKLVHPSTNTKAGMAHSTGGEQGEGESTSFPPAKKATSLLSPWYKYFWVDFELLATHESLGSLAMNPALQAFCVGLHPEFMETIWSIKKQNLSLWDRVLKCIIQSTQESLCPQILHGFFDSFQDFELRREGGVRRSIEPGSNPQGGTEGSSNDDNEGGRRDHHSDSEGGFGRQAATTTLYDAEARRRILPQFLQRLFTVYRTCFGTSRVGVAVQKSATIGKFFSFNHAIILHKLATKNNCFKEVEEACTRSVRHLVVLYGRLQQSQSKQGGLKRNLKKEVVQQLKLLFLGWAFICHANVFISLLMLEKAEESCANASGGGGDELSDGLGEEQTFMHLAEPLASLLLAILREKVETKESFPFLMKAFELAIDLERATMLYMPLGSLLVNYGQQIFGLQNVRRIRGNARTQHQLLKPFDWASEVMVKDDYLSDRRFQAELRKRWLDVLTDHMCLLARHPAFPEYSASVMKLLSKIMHAGVNELRKAVAATSIVVCKHRSRYADLVPPPTLNWLEPPEYAALPLIQLAKQRVRK